MLLRDKYTCKCCGHRGGTLEVHHLNGYNWFVEGRTDETNAVVLCQNCHTSCYGCASACDTGCQGCQSACDTGCQDYDGCFKGYNPCGSCASCTGYSYG